MADKPSCFVIMPISDCDGYVKGHFKHVYDDIVAPACEKAGFSSIRADQVKQSNLIHLDILQKLLEAPMAICDLSSRNPNVLFELALRQAFDKPVALIQEVGTAPVFDISPLRYTEYRKERTYHEVIEDQTHIATAIKETFEAHRSGKGVNSIVKLLGLSKPASLPDINASEAKADIQQLILAELSQLREEVRGSRRDSINERKHSRELVGSELSFLRDMLKEAEMRTINTTTMQEAERASLAIRECRSSWMRCMQSSHTMSSHERDLLPQYDVHIDMLEKELAATVDRLRDKKKKIG